MAVLGFSLIGRQCENRGGRYDENVLISESPERVADVSQRLEVRDVGCGEGVSLLRRGSEEVLPLPTECHHREIVDLGAPAAHVK